MWKVAIALEVIAVVVALGFGGYITISSVRERMFLESLPFIAIELLIAVGMALSAAVNIHLYW